MRILIVFNHPYEGSFCSAILKAARSGLEAAGHECDFIHLDHDEFDPVMRAKDLRALVMARSDPTGSTDLLDPQVRDYKTRIQQTEHIIFIFPIWWELMPALTKGFVDKVIFPGIAYDYAPSGKGMICRLDRLKGVTMITTMNTPALAYWLAFGNAIKKALFMGTFWKIGIKNRRWISFNSVKFVKPEKREKWLRDVELAMRNLT